MGRIIRQMFKTIIAVFPVLCLVACLQDQKPKDQKAQTLVPENPMLEVLKCENVVPAVIVGSGPAGLSAALYFARAGIKSFVFAGPMPHGQLTQTTYVENWPGQIKILGADLMDNMKQQVISFGAQIIHDTITKMDLTKWPFSVETEDGRFFKTLAVILATGSTPKALGVPGEKEFWGKGVTPCAICDAIFFKKKNVVIVGGGDSAAEMVLELAPYVNKVTVLVRKDAMQAAATMQKRVLECPNAAIEYHKEIKAIYGEKKQCQKHEENTCGCLNPEVCAIDVYDNATKTTQRRQIDGVFLAIGHVPNNKLIQNAVDLDRDGYVKMKARSQATYLSGVFAAGEIQDPIYRQAVVAAGEGAKAALDAASFLHSIGFTVDIGQQLDRKFFEKFSDEKIELEEIDQYDELEKVFAENPGVILVEFYCHDCPGCIRMRPVIEAIAYKLQDQIKVFKSDYAAVASFESPKHDGSIFRHLYRQDPPIKIKGLPALLVFKDGQCVSKTSRIMNKVELLEYVEQFL